ncbi:ABC transporter permease subunit [Chitinimonas arctica]|uniref:Histidine/lysine/arginine/ornithine transport system permease protein HisM n=1 Tax=Chitinimonas arctica TaxID=2594795 RepID=A0A516SAQ4_9NEIS|nr:ABC transporter permease subunit [Chitinimonas arctica]QDQ25128.1 ABC transporter permease subunit [Chitinimonas arctica]
MQFDIIFTPATLQLFWLGIVTSLKLTVFSVVIGGLLSIPMAIMRVSRNKWVSTPVWLYTYVMRGTPMLIQVYLIYYGIAQIEYVQANWDTVAALKPFKDAMFCAVLAFTLNTCAYTTEMLAGAIRDTNHGEIEAARAMGMGKWLMMRRIVLPSALRRTLPAYSNEVIMMLQGTSLASVVPAITDITGAARSIYSDYYLPFEAFISAGIIYLVLTFSLVGLFRLAERRWLAYLQPRKS